MRRRRCQQVVRSLWGDGETEVLIPADCLQRRLIITRYLPDMIKGDLDSIRPEVQAYYRSHVGRRSSLWQTLIPEQNVMVVRDEDQYSTDLMKCFKEIEKREHEEETSASSPEHE